MNPLPLPLRLAAGLVATAVEQARDLPRLMVEFPVTAISQTLQVSMRMQQKVTELAIKGDRALGVLRPVEETPAWATFDDEEAPPQRNGESTVTTLRPPNSRPAPRRATRASRPAAERLAEDTPTSAATDVAARTTAATADAEPPADVTTGGEGSSGPNALPGYREMSIPQLRARLRKLSEPDLRALLAWETAHDNRPPFVTMLTNRITTVTEG
jgi:hypothetical protein